MGVRLSIDKHVSNLHELLEMSAQYFQKVRFASKISGDIKQHLKVSSTLCNWTSCNSSFTPNNLSLHSILDLEIPRRQ